MTPGPRRLPIEICAVLCLTFHAVVLASDTDRGRSGAMGTCAGTILSIDREKWALTVEESSRVVNTFRLDDAATLIFRGVRPLRIDELRSGMRVEIDYRHSGGESLPTVTWIEVLEDKDK